MQLMRCVEDFLLYLNDASATYEFSPTLIFSKAKSSV